MPTQFSNEKDFSMRGLSRETINQKATPAKDMGDLYQRPQQQDRGAADLGQDQTPLEMNVELASRPRQADSASKASR